MPDLRLDRPFSPLKNYINEINLDTMDFREHSHVPYIVILYKFLELWKQENNGEGPKNYKEKKAFSQTLLKGKA